MGASIVADMAKEFSLDDIDFNKMETNDIDQLPCVRPSGTVAVETMGFFEGKSQSQDVESVMECEDSDEERTKSSGKKKVVIILYLQ